MDVCNQRADWLPILQNTYIPCQVEGYMYSTGTNRMRMRMFHTQQDVHPNHIFCPAVTSPSDSSDFKPRVDWSRFHQVVPLEEEQLKNPHLERVSKSWGALSSESTVVMPSSCTKPTCCFACHTIIACVSVTCRGCAATCSGSHCLEKHYKIGNATTISVWSGIPHLSLKDAELLGRFT